jgi:trehalose 6-phosphate synthase/phosphatase
LVPRAIIEATELRRRLAAVRDPVLLLDYDGTLVPLAPFPDMAPPDAELLHLVRRLSEALQLHIVSGRRLEDLETWFAGLDATLWAEHGAWRRPPRGEWMGVVTDATPWLPAVRRVLHDTAARLPGALVEEKRLSIAFHYRAADARSGERQARELRLRLLDLLGGETAAQVLEGSKVIEVRPRAAHKGRVVEQVLREVRDASRLVAIGDDRTDEEMFAAMPREGTTVRVGSGASRAAYRVSDSRAVRDLLTFVATLVRAT